MNITKELQQANLSVRFAALAIAHTYIGQKEIPAGSNAGEFVEGCLKLVGLGKGFAWCQAFVYIGYSTKQQHN